jgi:hypothetical protein
VVLRAKDVDLEVVDGLLGHGYGGCVTYGDWSTRQWQADMERVVPALEAAFDELALPILKVPVLHGAPEILDTQALPVASSVLLAVSSNNANGVKLLGGRRVL